MPREEIAKATLVEQKKARKLIVFESYMEKIETLPPENVEEPFEIDLHPVSVINTAHI